MATQDTHPKQAHPLPASHREPGRHPRALAPPPRRARAPRNRAMAATHSEPHRRAASNRPPPPSAPALPRSRGAHRTARDRRHARAHTQPRPGMHSGTTRPARQRLRQPAIQLRHPRLRAARNPALRPLTPLTPQHTRGPTPGKRVTRLRGRHTHPSAPRSVERKTVLTRRRKRRKRPSGHKLTAPAVTSDRAGPIANREPPTHQHHQTPADHRADGQCAVEC